MKLVDVFHNADGTVDASITNGKISVRCEGIAFLDVDAYTIEDIFYDWLDMANRGEEGYAVFNN